MGIRSPHYSENDSTKKCCKNASIVLARVQCYSSLVRGDTIQCGEKNKPLVTTSSCRENASSFFFFTYIYFPASGQAVVTGVVPSPPRLFPPIFIAHRVQQFHCSLIFHRVLLTHALALPASQFVHKKKPPRIYTSVHSGGFELTKLTYTRLEDNLIRHRGDRHYVCPDSAGSRLGARVLSGTALHHRRDHDLPGGTWRRIKQRRTRLENGGI